ncbi:MAG TPA: hypothetical protein VL551_34440 [Actinospica sp.]|jgi:hypothetical protein|nr:hypothetical protein [Actinospica sp.]
MGEFDSLDRACSGLAEPVAAVYRSLAWCQAVFVDEPALAVIADCPAPRARAMAASLIEAGLVRRMPGPAGAGLRIGLDAAGRLHAGSAEAGECVFEGSYRWADYLVGCAAAVERRVTPTHRLNPRCA